MFRKIQLIVVLLAASTTAFAGDDRQVLAHNDCGTGAVKRNTVAPPRVRETYEYYEVGGSCEKDLQCSMAEKAVRWNDGNKYDSVTGWKVKWDYAPVRASGSCVADAFTVSVDVTFRLPKWVRTDNVPPSLAKKWDAYLGKLMTHERGHRDLVVAAANELNRTVAQLSPAPTCAELERNIGTLCRARLEKLDQEQNRYDAATEHGITQGALFP